VIQERERPGRQPRPRGSFPFGGGLSNGGGGNIVPGEQLTFDLPLGDAGGGAVQLAPAYAGGSYAPTFTRATTAYTTLSNGLLVQVGSGVARSCYSSTGLYLGYLAEGARTNLCLQSQVMTDAAWSGNTAVVTNNAAVAPDGTTTADNVNDNSAVTTLTIDQPFTVAADATVRVWSIYIEKRSNAIYGRLRMRYSGSATKAASILLNYSTGAVTTIEATNLSASGFQDLGTYWRFYVASANDGANTSLQCQFEPAFNTDGTTSGDSAAQGSANAWGAQLEAAAFASSYIPTTTLAVTRNADVLTYAFTNNISNTAGSAYAEFLQPNGAANSNGTVISGGASTVLYTTDGTTASIFCQVGGAATTTGTGSLTATNKAAVSWNAGIASSAVINGGTVATGVCTSMGMNAIAIGRVSGGTTELFGTTKNVRIYGKALPAAQLQAMTA
jgi:hypothetical protein